MKKLFRNLALREEPAAASEIPDHTAPLRAEIYGRNLAMDGYRETRMYEAALAGFRCAPTETHHLIHTLYSDVGHHETSLWVKRAAFGAALKVARTEDADLWAGPKSDLDESSRSLAPRTMAVFTAWAAGVKIPEMRDIRKIAAATALDLVQRPIGPQMDDRQLLLDVALSGGDAGLMAKAKTVGFSLANTPAIQPYHEWRLLHTLRGWVSEEPLRTSLNQRIEGLNVTLDVDPYTNRPRRGVVTSPG